jgi:murein DD-endopeptidase MepM/ murein hydrolase activator NlpD
MIYKKYLIPLQYPVQNTRITQIFGANPLMYKRFGIKGHSGIDFSGLDNIFSYASHNGICTARKLHKTYGNMIKIKSLDGNFETIYAHLKKFNIQLSQKINVGECIGEIGSTGNSTGLHLHFGLRPLPPSNNGYEGYIDPKPYLTALHIPVIKSSVDNSEEARKERRQKLLDKLNNMIK